MNLRQNDRVLSGCFCFLTLVGSQVQVAKTESSEPFLQLASESGGSPVLFVEAERGGSKKHQDRREKWARCLQIAEGEINVVTTSKSVMEAVKSEIIRQIHQPWRLRLTNINQARALQHLGIHRVWIEKHSD